MIKRPFKLTPYSDEWLAHEYFSSSAPSLAVILNSGNITAVCVDETVYVYAPMSYDGALFIMDIINGNYEIIKKGLPYSGCGNQGIMINNEFHLIGGSKNTQHLKWNDFSTKMDTFHDISFINQNKIGHHRLIAIDGKVLMVGGFCYRFQKHLDRICEYDIMNDIWKVSDIKLPTKLCRFGCVSVVNNQFIILLGGQSLNFKHTDDIWIYCVKSKTFRKSGVK